MSRTRAAIRYAKAILSVAEDNNTSAKIHEEMNQIARAIASNPELNEVLKSPVVKLSEKTAVLDHVFSKSGTEVKSLFTTLAQNKRVDLLEHIASQYKRLYTVISEALSSISACKSELVSANSLSVAN